MDTSQSSLSVLNNSIRVSHLPSSMTFRQGKQYPRHITNRISLCLPFMQSSRQWHFRMADLISLSVIPYPSLSAEWHPIYLPPAFITLFLSVFLNCRVTFRTVGTYRCTVWLASSENRCMRFCFLHSLSSLSACSSLSSISALPLFHKSVAWYS